MDEIDKKRDVMKEGKCPRCGSIQVRKQQNGLQGGAEMKTAVWNDKYVTEPANIVTYLCIYCGYFENYLLDRALLSKATQKWTQVGGSSNQ